MAASRLGGENVNYLGSTKERLDRIETNIAVLSGGINTLLTAVAGLAESDPATLTALREQLAAAKATVVSVTQALAADDQQITQAASKIVPPSSLST
jgi:hypothetical protein